MFDVIRLDQNLLPFSKRDLAYTNQQEHLKPFLTDFPSTESLLNYSKVKSKHAIDRKLLVKTLLEQYKDLPSSEPTLQNIKALSNDTVFTVITAHQPVLMTGPLYYIFKICSCINLAKHLTSIQDAIQVVPVFISGGEDHDLEEVASFKLFKEKLTWQTEQQGAVGRMNVEGIEAVIETMVALLGERSQALELMQSISQFLNVASSYGHFQRLLVNHLFGDQGLVIVNSDDDAFKQALTPIFKEELLKQSSKPLVVETQKQLHNLGYGNQAFAREINLFYLTNGSRNRIVQDGANYKVLDTAITFTSDAIHEHVKHFSPNVILRPLCQEALLPNLCYIGGGGELAYWMERKTQFEHFGIPFPILLRRNSAAIIGAKQLQHWKESNLPLAQLFGQEHTITNTYLQQQEEEFTLEEARKTIIEGFEHIKSVTETIDKTLVPAVESAKVKELKVIDQIESRLRKSLKTKHEVNLNKLLKTRASLFPNGGLQERKDNIFTYISKSGPRIIQEIQRHLDPLDPTFTLLVLRQ